MYGVIVHGAAANHGLMQQEIPGNCHGLPTTSCVWAANAEGEATGYDMITEDGVIEEVRVANAEAKAVDKPAAKAPAVDSDVDMYE